MKSNPQGGSNTAGAAIANSHKGHNPDADDLADMHGRQPGDDGYNLFNTRESQ